MRRGITLLELIVVLAVAGILAAFALPAARRFGDAIAAENAAQAIVAAHRVARFTAIMRSQRTVLSVRPDSLVVSALSGVTSSTLWRHEGPAASGVALTGPAHALAFAPTGLPMGVSNGTFQLSRGAAVRRVVISRLGRIRLVRQ